MDPHRPALLRRRTVRMRSHDYSQQGAYFITVCTHDRQCTFGEVSQDAVVLSAWGTLVEATWLETSTIRPEVELDAYVVMPNHLHAIFFMWGDGATAGALPCAPTAGQHDAGALPCAPTEASLRREPRTVGALVSGFKGAATRRIRELAGDPGLKVWQRNYYEHVIRSEESLTAIREYIAGNPVNWALDEENPLRPRP